MWTTATQIGPELPAASVTVMHIPENLCSGSNICLRSTDIPLFSFLGGGLLSFPTRTWAKVRHGPKSPPSPSSQRYTVRVTLQSLSTAHHQADTGCTTMVHVCVRLEWSLGTGVPAQVTGDGLPVAACARTRRVASERR